MKKLGRLYILMLNIFIAMLGFGLIVPVMPSFIDAFGATGKTLGFLVAASGLTQFIFSPIAGHLTDKFGRRKLIIAGIAGFAIAQFIFAFAGQLWMLFVSRFLGGASAALLMPAMFAYIADITTERDRGKGMGLFSASMTLGFVIGPGVGGYLAEYGISFPFLIAGSFAAVSTLLSILFLPETLSMEKQHEARRKKGANLNPVIQMMQALRAPYAFLLMLVFVLNFGIIHFESVFGLYVNQKHGFTPKNIAFVITVAGLVGVFIQAVGVNALVKWLGEKLVVRYALLGAAFMLVACRFAPSFWFICTFAILFLACTSLVRPALNTLLSKMAGDQQGLVGGVNTSFMSLANIVGPSLAGILFDLHIELPFMFGTLVLLISFATSIAWAKKEQVARSVSR
ncbi:MFS transporter [Bacillus sp. NPDC077027]|uniref:MFS transporter n=1 Tax=Bacillus sp. NPDC077027 TaxID=3390548 RepID=UPI003CFEBE27